MDEIHRRRITKGIHYLSETTGNLDTLIAFLIASEVITLEDSEQIRHMVTTFDKCCLLYTIIMHKGPLCFEVLLNALRETGNDGVATYLEQDDHDRVEKGQVERKLQEAQDYDRMCKKRIRRHLDYLVANSSNLQLLATKLEAAEVLRTDERERIVTKFHNTGHGLAFKELYQAIRTAINEQRPSAYLSLLQTLHETQNTHVATRLAQDISDTEDFEEIAEGSIWFDVKEPVSNFTGRGPQLLQLHEVLQRNHTYCHSRGRGAAVLSQTTSISGLGGVGKSETARKYAREYHDYYESNIVWINAQSYDSMASSFLRLATDKLHLSTQTKDGQPKSVSAIVDSIYNFFSTRKCLFIFDNAEFYKSRNDDDEGLDKFLPVNLPPHVNKPYILITSRSQSWIKGMEVIALGTFTEHESIKFVQTSLEMEQLAPATLLDIKTLTEHLQHLPLALQQAVSYIHVNNSKMQNIGASFTIADYLVTFEQNAKCVLNYDFFNETDDLYTRTTFITWQITMAKIAEDEEVGDMATQILRVLSYMKSDDIPPQTFLNLTGQHSRYHGSVEEVLRAVAHNPEHYLAAPPQHKSDNTGRLQLGSALEVLRQYSMVSRHSGLFSIHRLVQHVTRLGLKEGGLEFRTLQLGLNLHNELISNASGLHSDKAATREILHQFYLYASNAKEVWSYASSFPKLVTQFRALPTQIISALNANASYHESAALSKSVHECFENTSQLSPTIFDKISIGKFEIASIVSQVQLGSPDALKEIPRLVKLFKNLESQLNYPDTPEVRARLADMEFKMEFVKCGYSIEALVRLYEAQCTERGSLHPFALEVLYRICSFSPETEFAVNLFAFLLDQQELACGPQHPHTLRTKSSFATELDRLGQHQRALDVINEVISDTAGEGAWDQNVTNQATKARILINLNRLEEALTILDTALCIQNAYCPPKHPTTADIMWDKADALRGLGQVSTALTMYEEIIKDQESVLGSKHPHVLGRKVRHAQTLRKIWMNTEGRGGIRPAELSRGLADLYETLRVNLGELHYYTLMTKLELARHHRGLRNYEEAVGIAKELEGIVLSMSPVDQELLDCTRTEIRENLSKLDVLETKTNL